MISFLGSLLMVLKFVCIIAVICTACLVVDTVLNVKYYLWEKEKHLQDASELVQVAQYDEKFFDDGK